MTTEYSRNIRLDDDRDDGGLNMVFAHIKGVEVLITDNIFASVLKHSIPGEEGYADIRSPQAGVAWALANGMTHKRDDGSFLLLINPTIPAGVAAHESLHVIEAAKLPHDDVESWNYPLGALTNAVLAIRDEAIAAHTFSKTVNDVHFGSNDPEEARTLAIEKIKEALIENGLPPMTATEVEGAEFEIDMHLGMGLPPSLMQLLTGLGDKLFSDGSVTDEATHATAV